MHTIRFIHCADLHLGAELSSLEGLGASRREELFMTFETILALCRREKPDFLFISGDLFDMDAPEPPLVKRVKELLASAPETEILIAPGNHDYLSARSPYLTEWSPNVHIFTSDKNMFMFEGKETCVYGAGFTASYEPEPLLEKIPKEKKGNIRIGVLHGELSGSSPYNPLQETSLRACGLQYLALGHVHQPSPKLMRAGKTTYAYSGSPEGLGFDELGPRGVYAGSISSAGEVKASFFSLCRRMYAAPAIDITGCESPSAQEKAVLSSLKLTFGEEYEKHLYKIYLRGDCRLSPEDIRALQTRLSESLYYCKLRDQTALEENLEALSQETSLKGMFVREMLRRLEEPAAVKNKEEQEKNRRALQLGLRALEGDVAGDED